MHQQPCLAGCPAQPVGSLVRVPQQMWGFFRKKEMQGQPQLKGRYRRKIWHQQAGQYYWLTYSLENRSRLPLGQVMSQRLRWGQSSGLLTSILRSWPEITPAVFQQRPTPGPNFGSKYLSRVSRGRASKSGFTDQSEPLIARVPVSRHQGPHSAHLPLKINQAVSS